MKPDFAAIDQMRIEWDRLQPLSTENEMRLWRKLRLEWNYHSNHIEGNTLTYGETELLLLHDRVTGDHPLRDYEEMKAHDLGIAYVRQLAAEARALGEADIRDLNKLILKEPFWKAAITPTGEPTRKQIIPGEYKSSPNNVRTATGEIFAFASPTETPPRMRELIEWLRAALEGAEAHLLETVARFHHEFVLIHPFDDGNGRVARLLMNYVLLRRGYPPVIVKSEDKAGYLTALRLADAGDPGAFTGYLARELEWSLRLGVKAAKGESIEEPGDVEKELTLFIRHQQAHAGQVQRRSPEAFKELAGLGWRRLFEKFEEKIGKLYPLFLDHAVEVSPRAPDERGAWQASFESFVAGGEGIQFEVTVHLCGYKGRAESPFDVDAALGLFFGDYEYRVRALNEDISRKLYSQPLLADEAELLCTGILKRVFEQIKRQSGEFPA